jgi:glycine/D-amino acid oxidase-like deaminating enzyme
VKDYRSYSMWLETVGDDLTPRAPLQGDAHFDVAIVGGGYTGLWTAYYLKLAEPSLDIAILERDICGFGASGRNGGWCSALFAGARERIARRHGSRDAAIALQRAMFDSVDEVGRVAQAEGIDCDWHKGGMMFLATAPTQLERTKSLVDYERAWGFGDEDFTWLDAVEASQRITIDGLLGAVYSPHCARIHPAKLARGLARTVASKGIKVYEQTQVDEISGKTARTQSGVVTADVVVRATEGYTAMLPGMRRALMPVYSLMIATEPLPHEFWDKAGWRNRETFTDGRHLLIYAQRTADDRIALGGRGAPYHYGSRVSDDFEDRPEVFAELRRVLGELLPGTKDARITHTWGGPLGIPRDWHSSVGFDRDAGLAWAGGYVGDGVSTANLAGRTLADLITNRQTDITVLPWVNHRSRKWEPEPLRWVGTNLAIWATASADRLEARRGRPARRARLVKRLIGQDH